ncbi:hypothetical protein yberc0001_33220 [Yersinia bercovieri ATCC 43970]|uniref:Uncharacterized protein n=1 Tax=Yersinia bercovieri ATCC 43970 TaxID=349968 RepID=A0ABM9Y238_YERBE|nr:hypothetical protein yberc0001_33220 [Yersinia bercovieri ATCC 43970]
MPYIYRLKYGPRCSSGSIAGGNVIPAKVLLSIVQVCVS